MTYNVTGSIHNNAKEFSVFFFFKGIDNQLYIHHDGLPSPDNTPTLFSILSD